MTSHARRGLLACLIPLAILPPADLAAQDPWTVRDSAGVRIVENHRGVWTPDQAWRISEEPVLRIGRADGPESELLFGAAWSGFLSDGSIVVLNAGSHDVRIFDAEGEHVLTFGRQGEGPGEFQGPETGVVLPGDTIVIQDRQDLKFFDRDGRFLRQVRITGGRPFPWPRLIGRVPDGLLFRDGDWENRTFRYDASGERVGMEEVIDGVDRGAYAIVEYGTDGALHDTLSHSFGQGETWIGSTERSRSYSNVFFSPGQHWGIGPASLVTGYSKSPTIRFLDLDGRPTQVVSLPIEPTEVGEERFWDRFERSFGEEPAEIQARSRESYEKMPIYEHAPYFGGIGVDPGGVVWVQSYSPEDLGDEPRWFVVSPRGVFLGVVQGRPRIWVDAITRDFVLGRGRTDMGVEQVLVYRILKPR